MEGRTEQARAEAIHYPESDGRPMGETDRHRREMQRWVIEVLEHRFADQPDVYVSGNNFIYFEEGEPSQCVSPDAYVVRGVPKKERRTFKVWEEGGHRPCVVIEITSRKTRREDQRDKHSLYASDLGVPEYFLFDPEGDWIKERLRGYRLSASGHYEPIEPVNGRLPSRELGLELLVCDDHLRFLDPSTEEMLPTDEERIAAEQQRADEAERRARAAEARAEELAREVERLRGESDPSAPRDSQ